MKSDVNLGQSANSLQTNTTERSVSNKQSKLSPLFTNTSWIKGGTELNTSENILLERGKKTPHPSQNEPWWGFARTATYVHHWVLCAQTGPDPVLRQQAAGAYQLPGKLATDPSLVTSYLTQVSPTGSSPRHRLCLRGCTLSRGLFSRLQLRNSSLSSSLLIRGQVSSYSSLSNKASCFCCKANPKVLGTVLSILSLLTFTATQRDSTCWSKLAL